MSNEKAFVSQPPASEQYADWKKYPNTYREPTHEEWLLEVHIHQALRKEWQTLSVTSIAAENPSVAERIAALGAENAALKHDIERAVQTNTALLAEIAALKAAND